MGKDSKYLPTLSRECYEDWFRRAKVKVKSKGVFYTIETTRTEFAWIPREGGIKSQTPASETPSDSTVDDITNAFERLGGSWNLDKSKQWDQDDSKALEIILEGLGEEDAVLIDEYETAAAVWTQLKLKYDKTSSSTANQYMTRIQNFTFNKDTGIDGSWSKLKEYRRKVIAANAVMKNAYPDEALLLILTIALQKQGRYTAVVDGFMTQQSLTVDEKIKILQEKESRLGDMKPRSASKERANAAWRQHKEVYRHPNHQSRRSSDASDHSMTGVSRECFCCGSADHFVADCEFQAASREFARNLRIDKEKTDRRRKHRDTGSNKDKKSGSSRNGTRQRSGRSDTKPSSSSKHSSQRKKRGYAAVHDSDTNESDTESQTDGSESEKSNDDKSIEKVMLSKESISKSTPQEWAVDTGASSSMTDQLHLFRKLRSISKVHIQVGGGMLFSCMRGIAMVKAVDGTSCFLENVLYVPNLGVNLLSAKKLCKGGYKGAFDDESIWITEGNKRVLKAEQSQGLYIVNHVGSQFQGKTIGQAQKKDPSEKKVAFAGQEVEGETSSDNDNATGDGEVKRYLKYHQRFAHLGPNTIRNLHKVTTLEKKVKIPKDLDICDVCALTKMKNRIRKELSVWPTETLDLVQFDVAGPFQTTIRGNRYFLLIIDICSRRTWVIPLKTKGDAYQALKNWKVNVELQSGKKIKRARSDNAPELLKATDDWRIEDGVLAQSTTIASSHQNGPAERSIQTVEFDMRAMLEDAKLPLEFWDEAAEADSYMRNRTATGPMIDGKKTCPMKAFTGETPSIDHIRKWGSKCFYYIDKKTIPSHERHDKLVNPGRVGVFMGYSENTTKHFKVYSPERGSTILSSRVTIKESTQGGTVDLRIRNCASGPQGTTNAAPDRKARGRPKAPEEIQEDEPSGMTPQVEIPSFTPPADIPRYDDNDNLVVNTRLGSQEPIAVQSPSIDQDTQEAPPLEPESNVEHVPQDKPMEPTPNAGLQTGETSSAEPQAVTASGGDNVPETMLPAETENADPQPSTSPTEPEAPRYFTRSRKRAGSDAEEQGEAKRIRAMLSKTLLETDEKGATLIRAMMVKTLHEANGDWDDKWNEFAFAAEEIAGIMIPQTHKEAISGAHAKEWRAAMSEEMLSLYANGTFREVIPPKGSNLVSCKWVFTIKTTVHGKIERFKARLVARGFSQVHGQDYDQTFAPTVRMDTLRMFLAIVAKEDLECRQYDIKNAFTESELKEQIFLKVPEGINVKKGYVWQALKSLYGLKQAARDWNRLMKAELVKWGFNQCASEPCAFVHPNGVKLLVYVDDIVAAAKCKEELDWFYKKLSLRFNAKNLGEINKILGARVTRDRQSRSLEIDQEQYLRSVLDKFGITQETFKPKRTPATGYENLRPATDKDERINVTEYQQVIGSLMYAMIFTRPDIAFILGKLSQFMSDPAIHHGHAIKSLLRYLNSTIKTRIRYGPGGEHSNAVLYSDADWASDKIDRKSISGSVTMFYGGPTSWSSKKQRSVATSSCESEYMALAACAKQGQWFAQVLKDLGYAKFIGRNHDLVQMFGDNQGAIALTKNAHLNERSKHIDIAYHFVRDLAERGSLRVDYVPTSDMVADGMTKPLDRVAFGRFKSQMGLVEEIGR